MVNGLALNGLDPFGGTCPWGLDGWHCLSAWASRAGAYIFRTLGLGGFIFHIHLGHENRAFEKAQRVHHPLVEKLGVNEVHTAFQEN